MKKTVKIIGWAFLALLILTIGYGIYSYQTSPIMKALANNDESKLFYRPTTEMKSMEGLEFSENTLNPSDSIKIFTYQFKQLQSRKPVYS